MAKRKGGKKKKSGGIQTEGATEQTQLQSEPAPEMLAPEELPPEPAEVPTKEEPKEPVLSEAVSEVIGEKESDQSSKKEKKALKKFKAEVAKFAADGHDVSGLESMMDTASAQELKDALKEFESGIEANGKIKTALQELKPDGMESDFEAVNKLLADPMKHREASASFEALRFKRRSGDIMSALNKMVLPSMKEKVEAMKAMLQNSQDLDAIEQEFANLRREYKEAYAEDGVKAQIVSSQPEPAKQQAPKGRAPMTVKDIFLLYRDGKFISHHTNRVVTKEQQKELFADLKIGRDFLRSPKYMAQKINVIPAQNKSILVQSGRFTVVIVVAEGSVDPWSEKIITKVITLMENEDQMQLKDWNGDVSVLKSSGKYMQALLFAFMKLGKKGQQ